MISLLVGGIKMMVQLQNITNYTELVAYQLSIERQLNAKLSLNVQRLVGDHISCGKVDAMDAKW